MAVEGADKAVEAVKQITPKTLTLIRKIFGAEAVALASHVRAEHMTGGTTDTRLRVRTGKLRASVRSLRNTIEGTTVRGGISIGTVYGRVHVGPKGQITHIVPKEKKWLTIPLPAAQTKAGVLRGAAQSGMWGKVFFAKSKKGNLILFGRRIVQRGPNAGKATGDIVPLFLLRASVDVPARVHPEEIIAWEERRMINALMEIGLKIKS